jgi:hypothetical protein
MSVIGPKRTFRLRQGMSAIGGKADMDIRWVPFERCGRNNQRGKRSFSAVADGLPGNGEEACANVHADGLAALERVPEIGLDIDPVRACGRGVGIDLDQIPDRAAFWSP